jgi:hypothetical protein
MFKLSCPSCMLLIFSSPKLSPCPVPVYDQGAVIIGSHRMTLEGEHKLSRSIRCKCGFLLGEWVLSSDGDLHDCWSVNGLWSSNHDLETKLFAGDVTELAQKNEALRKALIARITSLAQVVERMAIKLAEQVKRYLLKLASPTVAASLVSHPMTALQQLKFCTHKIQEDLTLVQQTSLKNDSMIKKSVKRDKIN